MNYQIINVATAEDIQLVQDFINNVKFQTKEDHIPLHDPLYSQHNVEFDIATYGDMTREVVAVFEKYATAIGVAVSDMTKIFYDPPILGKSYIFRLTNERTFPMQWSTNRPKNVFRSILKWTDSHSGGELKFKNYKIAVDLKPGDCVIFPETEEFQREITTIDEGDLFVSDFWNAPVGESPYPGLKYNEITWGNPRFKNL
jgi:hypothetical protein